MIYESICTIYDKFYTTVLLTIITPQDRKEVTAVILEASTQLQWLTCGKEEVEAMEQHNQSRRMNILMGQLLGEEQYANLHRQVSLLMPASCTAI